MSQFHKLVVTLLLIFLSHAVYAKDAELLLLKTYDDSQDVTGWLMSEKLDGMRAIWDGEALKIRNGNEISAPKWFLQALPPFALDGELWTKRGDFENIISIVRQQTPDNRWRKISYQVFEVPNQPGDLLDRLTVLQDYLDRMAVLQNDLERHPSHLPLIAVIPQSIVQSADHLKIELDKVISLGGEGLVVRKPDTPYLTGRSNHALKVKQYQDTECTVIGHKAGKGKYAGKVGSLHCQLPSGITFYIGSGLSDQQRQSPPKIGSIITFKYYGLTKNNIPRFPVFLRIRQTQ
ncbi:MAG: DNA ligase [Methylophaga sp.]|nr:DNA ligase [Methylophaga sp.]